MFNIRNLVNRIAQGKDGDSETSSIRSRTLSQASSVLADEGIPVEAEGFLCPTCMAAFPSADSLQAHYEKEHLEPGANYLCPVCKARLDNAAELEQHYSAQHSTSATRAKGDLDVLMQEINSLTSSLNEERWGSEELRKEVSMMKEMLKVHGSGEEHQMYQQQIQGLSETKSLLTSEVVLLRKQLAEALETTLNLKQERDKLEEKAARNSQTVAQLQASLDENTGLVAALKEDIKSLESTIEHNRPSVDDAEVLKKELASVQRLMNELTVAKETELGDLKKELFDLQLEYEALKEKYSRNDQDTSADVPSLEVENRMQQLESDRHHLIENLEIQKEEANEARRILAEKNEQLLSMQRIRDETDICVGQLRQEVTSLQEMLNQARHQAEGQVSAKECELMQFKLDLSKHQQQVDNLEKQCQSLRQTNDQLTNSVSQKEAEIKELQLSLKQLSDTSHQLEEKTARLEEDKAELLLTIEKGEGADTAIQQLQQDNARLQDELANCSLVIASLKSEQKVKTDEWTVLENQLKEEKTKFQDVINNQSKDLEAARERNTHLEASVGEFSKEIEEHKMKYVLLESKIKEKEKIELEQERKVQEKDRELAQLEASLKSARADIAQKDDVAHQLTSQLELTKGCVEKIEGVLKDRENEVNQLTAARQQDAKELDQAQTRLADKVRVISELEERVKQLEPLTEAVEQEKLRRIKEKAEWNEHEQLLRGEKESLATLSTHLQQQVEEQATEHRIHLQRLKSESEALLKDKNQLIEQLNGLKDTRTKENNDWLEKQIRFEEELKSLRSSLSAAEDLSATRYQRCEDLQASAEKYHSLKIELETRLALLEEEKIELQNNCSQWENEVDRLKFNAAELRRRLEDSQAALHELGRENQSLQMENAKLQGRKWADDSEVNDCHSCQKGFNLTVRKHHCRNCGQIFCNECSSKSTAVGNSRKPVRVCDSCFKELTINSPR